MKRSLALAVVGLACLAIGFTVRGLPQGETIDLAVRTVGERLGELRLLLVRSPSLTSDETQTSERQRPRGTSPREAIAREDSGDEITVVETAAQPAGNEPAEKTKGEPEERVVVQDFAFTRLRIDTDGDAPEACLIFNKPLSADPDVKFEDYLLFSPDVTPVLRADANRLCIAGLAFGQAYQVTLRRGLPAIEGETLQYDETVTVELDDRPAAIAFGSGVILPREGSDGVPITTVNVDSLKIQVIRVGDQILSQIRSGLLNRTDLYRYQAQNILNENGSLVWSGTMDVDGERNATTRTVFPLGTVLPEADTSVYLIFAEDASYADEGRNRGPSAAQWVVQSDLALTSFSGSSEMRVFVRSLATAEPVVGVKLELLARNNEVLGTATSGADGSASFDPGLLRGTGGMTPVMVMAYGEEDFMILDLRRSAFDLSDRGVDGRPAATGVDAFVYLDRGIYRPGETVQLAALVRDDEAKALTDLPLTIIVRRPDGIEFRRLTATVGESGAVHVPVTLSRTAPRGLWRAWVYLDPEDSAIGSATFDVQDFVPERLDVKLENDAEFLRPGDEIDVAVMARYLYDAPGKGLNAEASMRVVTDNRPFEDYRDYTFSQVDQRFSPTYDELDITTTDEEGRTKAVGTLRSFQGVTRPLRADITVAVFEPGGRLTRKQISIPVRPSDRMVGIRSSFRSSLVRRNTPAGFDIVALDAAGEPVDAGRMDWNVVQEVVSYKWYQRGSDWRYQRIVRDRPMDAGSIEVGEDGPARVEIAGLSYGGYRFEVRDRETGALSSVRFWSGWYGGRTDGRPDRVMVTADRTSYTPGDTATVTIRPPMPGKALVTIAGSTVFGTRMIDLPEGDTTIEVPVDAAWQTGAYVIVNAYRPVTGDGSQVPVRAIGLVHLGVEQNARELTVDFELPERISPQSTVAMPVRVARREGDAPLTAAHVTVAAVDTGILNLTGFEAPAPEDHYFSKRRLGIEIRDDYGRLIRGTQGTVGETRSGGDGFGDAGGLQVVPTRTVALYSGIVPLDAKGEATVPLEVPDFVGELTVMAVAFSTDAVGHGSQPVTVRGNVVADLFLPRFLAPGDEAQVSLQVNNVAGPEGDYTALISGEGAVGLGAEASASTSQTLSLQTGDDARETLTIVGGEPGFADLRLNVTGPDDLLVERSWPIQVRAARPFETQVSTGALEPGTFLDYGADMIGGYYSSSAGFSVTVSAVPGIDVSGLLASLYRYPYGCLEQTISRGFPLLYFNDLAAANNLTPDEDLPARLQDAVDRVLDLQKPNGSFGMWSRTGRDAYNWLSVFALDFLIEARKQGLVVPLDALNRGQQWLLDTTQSSYKDASARAYAYYVLARSGRARIGDLRYFFDTQRENLEAAIGLAFLGAALDAAGDRARGRTAFTQAVDQVTKGSRQFKTIDYGSRLRDLAAVTALAVRSRRLDLLPPLFERRESMRRRLRFTTTQEKVWLLLLAHELREAQDNTALTVSVTGSTARDDGSLVTVSPSADELAEGIRIENTGDTALWYVATARGIPDTPQEAQARGLTIDKTILTLEGEPVDVAALRQSQRYVVLLQGKMDNRRFREMGLIDLLPAGFEIETVLRGGGSGDPQYPWLPRLYNTQMTSARDDRFLAAFDIGDRYPRRPRDGQVLADPTFAVAYVVRAVTPGQFALPAAQAEDMYAPRILARTDEGQITILPVGAPEPEKKPQPQADPEATLDDELKDGAPVEDDVSVPTATELKPSDDEDGSGGDDDVL